MLVLTEHDKRKLKGRVYLLRGDNEKAIECFDRALELNDDPEIYYYKGLAYSYLRDYKTARDYALKSIRGGYDAFALYVKISVGNLLDINGTVAELKKGIEKRSPSACLEMAKLHIYNVSEPDMLNPYEASKYLELAYRYTPIAKRGLAAYMISTWYRALYSQFPYFLDFQSENSELYYLKQFNEYGGTIIHPSHLNSELFDAFSKNDDYGIIQTLFDSFDGDALFIFALLLLREEFTSSGTIVITNNFGLLVATEGAKKFQHGGCYALAALCFNSDFEGCEFDDEQAVVFIECSKSKEFVVPKSLESFYKELMNHLYTDTIYEIS